MELQLGGEALGDRRRAELGSAEAQALGGQTAPSPFWCRAGGRSPHTLCWLGAGAGSGPGLLPPTSLGREVPPPLPEIHFLKNYPRAKHLATGSDPRPVPSPGSPNQRGHFRPGLSPPPPLQSVHEPVAVACATLEGRRPGALFSQGFPFSPKSSPSLGFICPSLPRPRTQTTLVHNLISIGLGVGDREVPGAPAQRSSSLRARVCTRRAPWAGGRGCCGGPVLAPGQDWGQPGGGGRPGQPEPREGPSQRPVAVVPGADGNFVSWCARSDFQHIQKAALSLSGKPR